MPSHLTRHRDIYYSHKQFKDKERSFRKLWLQASVSTCILSMFNVTSLFSSISFNGFKMTVLVQTPHPSPVVFVCFYYRRFPQKPSSRFPAMAPVLESQSTPTPESAKSKATATINPQRPNIFISPIFDDTSFFEIKIKDNFTVYPYTVKTQIKMIPIRI